MNGTDARSHPGNMDMCGKLEGLKRIIEDIKTDIGRVEDGGGTYALPQQLIEIMMVIIRPVPVGWVCKPPAVGHWSELQTIKPAEIRSAIEDLQQRIKLIELIIKGSSA